MNLIKKAHHALLFAGASVMTSPVFATSATSGKSVGDLGTQASESGSGIYTLLLTSAAVVGIFFIIAGFAAMYQGRGNQESNSDHWKKVALGGALNMIVAILIVVSTTFFGQDQTGNQRALLTQGSSGTTTQ